MCDFDDFENDDMLPHAEGTESVLSSTPSGRGPAWYALWTRGHCEERVQDQLLSLGLDVFLPRIVHWQRLGRRRTLRPQALFPGYLFVRHDMDRASHIAILRTRGVVRVLGERWDRLSQVPDDEVSAVRRLLESGTRVRRHPSLEVGKPVRISRGPLEGLVGTFAGQHDERGTFCVTVQLLQRSVAVTIGADLVEPL